uniref:Heat shock protein Hsp15 n=2 Tax=Ectopseudomonas TaxID=3236654 RepID=A4XP72_ECTM1
MIPRILVVPYDNCIRRPCRMRNPSESQMSEKDDDKVRLDKWLWAARFYKTRALAKAAIEGGKVHHRGERCKPGKEPRIGDEYVLRTGFDERTVVVLALSAVRRGAPEAQLLYRETDESIARREQAAAMRKAGALGMQTDGRPSKKQRRQIHQFNEQQEGGLRHPWADEDE